MRVGNRAGRHLGDDAEREGGRGRPAHHTHENGKFEPERQTER